jgi:hypothetical protein
MDTEHIVFLIAGAAVVFVVGQLIIQSGRRYIAAGGSARRGAASGANLVAVLFHLITLGLVALFDVLPIGGPPAQRFLLRLGILLVVLALVYGVTLSLLNRRREEALVTEYDVRERHDPGEITYGVGPEVRVEPVRTDPAPGRSV